MSFFRGNPSDPMERAMRYRAKFTPGRFCLVIFVWKTFQACEFPDGESKKDSLP
jgi:hypothetical protein